MYVFKLSRTNVFFGPLRHSEKSCVIGIISSYHVVAECINKHIQDTRTHMSHAPGYPTNAGDALFILLLALRWSL